MARAVSRLPTDVRAMARVHTEMALRVLAGVARNADCPPASRVAACTALLDRGWGRAPQEHTGIDGGDIRVTIRHIIDSVDETDMKTIEHDVDEEAVATT